LAVCVIFFISTTVIKKSLLARESEQAQALALSAKPLPMTVQVWARRGALACARCAVMYI
jgi:hypothetical protein